MPEFARTPLLPRRRQVDQAKVSSIFRDGSGRGDRLGRMLTEKMSGDADITSKQRATLDELTAEAEKHRLGY